MPQAPTWPPPLIPPPGPAGAAAGTVWTPLTLVEARSQRQEVMSGRSTS